MKAKIVKPRYELWSYDGKTASTETITKDDVLSLDERSADHILALDLGIWGFRTAEGKWVEYDLSERSLGSISLKILDVVRCEPGEYFSPADIAEFTGLRKLKNPNNLSARWRAIRLAHLETYQKPNFFLSKRAGGMGIAWNPAKTFIHIEKVRANETNAATA